jgi:hypothetical protein
MSGRPISAAAATESSEPEINPAGNPSSVKIVPPTAPIRSVSAVRNRTCGEVADDDGIDSDQCAARRAASNGR